MILDRLTVRTNAMRGIQTCRIRTTFHIVTVSIRVLWYNGCNGRKPGMRVSTSSESIHQRAGSRLFPPENLVTTVPRFGRSDPDLE